MTTTATECAGNAQQARGAQCSIQEIGNVQAVAAALRRYFEACYNNPEKRIMMDAAMSEKETNQS